MFFCDSFLKKKISTKKQQNKTIPDLKDLGIQIFFLNRCGSGDLALRGGRVKFRGCGPRDDMLCIMQ